MLSGEGDELAAVAVDTLACGPLAIVRQPDHVEDDMRDQHALFMRAKMLNGDEHELMFHMEQVGLLIEMCSDVMHRHMLQALEMLDAPQSIRDDYATTMERDIHNMEVRKGIISAAEAAMRVHEVKDGGDGVQAMLDSLMDNPTVRKMMRDIIDGIEDDES